MKLFITGTDTGIGKTWVSAALALEALAQGKRVIYYKPIQTGTPEGEPPEDPHFIEQATQGQVQTVCTYCFVPPVTPSVADIQGIIALETVASTVTQLERECDLLLIEGAGGLMVPISPNTMMIDLIAQLGAPAVLVSHVRLGTLNHTLLSLEALQRRGLPLQELIINDYPRDLTSAPASVQSLLPTLQDFLPPGLPLRVNLSGPAPSAAALQRPFSAAAL